MSSVLFMLFAVAVQANFIAAPSHIDGRAAERECPAVMMSCPDDLRNADSLPLSVSVTWKKSSTSNLTYKWEVVKGEIISGQGTDSIKVKLPTTTSMFTATVVVRGLPTECPNTASCSIAVCSVKSYTEKQNL
ncbi:MAG: hypothetical protein MSG64_00270 [Pyrinomonadaceae bacterium MAG19_C2-C3]|nr:hypothetical protein [Pyrinomonadaceae bacterium MAG19_C2-C3]